MDKQTNCKAHFRHGLMFGIGIVAGKVSIYTAISLVKHIVKAANRTSKIEDIAYCSYADCEAVLDEMNRRIHDYGMVSVSDLHDVLGIPGERYTDSKYGWTDTSGIRVISCGKLFKLQFPCPTRFPL